MFEKKYVPTRSAKDHINKSVDITSFILSPNSNENVSNTVNCTTKMDNIITSPTPNNNPHFTNFNDNNRIDKSYNSLSDNSSSCSVDFVNLNNENNFIPQEESLSNSSDHQPCIGDLNSNTKILDEESSSVVKTKPSLINFNNFTFPVIRSRSIKNYSSGGRKVKKEQSYQNKHNIEKNNYQNNKKIKIDTKNNANLKNSSDQPIKKYNVNDLKKFKIPKMLKYYSAIKNLVLEKTNNKEVNNSEVELEKEAINKFETVCKTNSNKDQPDKNNIISTKYSLDQYSTIKDVFNNIHSINKILQKTETEVGVKRKKSNDENPFDSPPTKKITENKPTQKNTRYFNYTTPTSTNTKKSYISINKEDKKIVENKGYKTQLCKYIFNNSCTRGDECTYSHDFSKFPCKAFFIKNDCRRNSDCLFSHDKNIDKYLVEKLKEDDEETNNVDNVAKFISPFLSSEENSSSSR